MGGIALLVTLTLALLALAAVSNSRIDGYVVAFLLPLILAVLLAKDEQAYGRALVDGLSRPMFATIALAVLLAAIAGGLVRASGAVETLAGAAVSAGMTGRYFVGFTFLLTCLIAFSTGTSVGSYFVVVPILFPAGVKLGADPAFLIGAIAAGGAFGDNLAPTSDTTIASATTQGVDLGGVVRTRAWYSLPVAVASLAVYLALSPGGAAAAAATAGQGTDARPVGLLMLAVPVVIIAQCLRRKHLVTALASGSIVGLLLGLASGMLRPAQLISWPAPFQIEGLLPESIAGAMSTVAFLLVIFPYLGLLDASGALRRLGVALARSVSGTRGAEAVTVAATGLLSVASGVISVAILSVGDSVRDLGRAFDVNGYRRANLMDCAGTAFCYAAPWTVHAIVPAMLAGANAPDAAAPVLTPLDVPLHNAYAWLMLLMVTLAVVTGYGRTRGRGRSSMETATRRSQRE